MPNTAPHPTPFRAALDALDTLAAALTGDTADVALVTVNRHGTIGVLVNILDGTGVLREALTELVPPGRWTPQVNHVYGTTHRQWEADLSAQWDRERGEWRTPHRIRIVHIDLGDDDTGTSDETTAA